MAANVWLPSSSTDGAPTSVVLREALDHATRRGGVTEPGGEPSYDVRPGSLWRAGLAHCRRGAAIAAAGEAEATGRGASLDFALLRRSYEADLHGHDGGEPVGSEPPAWPAQMTSPEAIGSWRAGAVVLYATELAFERARLRAGLARWSAGWSGPLDEGRVAVAARLVDRVPASVPATRCFVAASRADDRVWQDVVAA